MANVYDKVKKQYLRSVHTPDFLGNPNYLINPDTSLVEGEPVHYWKEVDGTLLAMSQAEKDVVDAAIAQQDHERRLAFGEMIFNTDPVTKAIVKLMFKEINKLRVLNGDPAYTVEQFNSALQAELEASV